MRKLSGFEPKMWGPTIIGFGSYHYKYSSGHEGDAMLIGFSPRKAEFSLYVSAPGNNNKKLLAIPAIIVMVMALKDKKKSYYGAHMSYKQGLISGLILSIIIAALSPFTQWLTSYVISPEYFPNVIKRSVELGYYKTTTEAEANFNYQNYAIQGAMGAMLMGVLTTAIAMIFIRTKNSK